MKIYSKELENFHPPSWELKPFDLKNLKDLERNHPFQKLMFIMYKYYPNYQTGDDDVDGIDYYGNGLENDAVEDLKYFEMLDNFYRYGIAFQKEYEVHPGNILHVFSEYDKDNKQYHYLLDNVYDLKSLIFNDVKYINLNECDQGEITLSEIEKWKRKVVNSQQNKKTKLALLDPIIYDSFITFYNFSKNNKPNTRINYYLTWEGIHYCLDRKNKKYKYEMVKNYEDKLAKKVLKFLT